MVNGANYSFNYMGQPVNANSHAAPIIPYLQPAYSAQGYVYSSAAPQLAPGGQPPIYLMPAPKMQQPIIKDVFQPSNIVPFNTAQTVQNTLAKVKTNKAKLSLFFINDIHGHIDNMTNILGASKQFDKDAKAKGADAIKLSAGDNYTGGDLKRNSLMLKFLDFIGVKVSAVGNHEFDSNATNFYKLNADSNVKFVAANAKIPEGSEFYNNVQKSMILEENGNKYGVVGLVPFDLESAASTLEGLEGIKPYGFEESVKLVQAEVDKLRAQGVNKIILLSHIGIDEDAKIASMLDGVDIIQGGHSHNLTSELKEGQTILKSKTGEPVVLVQAGENGKYAGVLDVEFDENGIITTASMDINKAELEKSPVLEYIKNSVLGVSPKVGSIQAIDPTPENRRIVSCAWTNFLADSMRAELNTDVAFVNAANMRKVPKIGTLTQRDITDTTPLKNTLMVSKMTEKEIVRVVKEAAKTSFSDSTGYPGIMHVSGISYKINKAGDLLEMSFVDKSGNKTPIDINNPDDNKFYTVAHDTFVAEEREKVEYPGMLISARKNQEVQHYNFDKDKTAADYISKLPNKEELVVTDDKRIEIV